MVEAIEDLFIPVLVYNNKKEDEHLLKKFNEPSWNNPIVRYLDADLKDVLPRRQNIWTLVDTANRMADALKAAKRNVPNYLQLVAQSETSSVEKAEFSML